MIVINDKNCFRTDDDGYIIEGATGLETVQWGWIFRAIQASDEIGTIFLGVIEWDYVSGHLPQFTVQLIR